MSQQPFDPTQAAEVVKHYRPLQDILPKHWADDTITANDIRQHYYRTGAGKPVVVALHGIMESALSWLRPALALQADYDVILLDARGHGLSERMAVAKEFTQEQLTEDVAAFIRALNLGPVHVLGFSQGAGTGIHLADSHPDLVRSLIAAGMGDNAGMSGQTANSAPTTDMVQSPGYQAWLSRWTAWLEGLRTQTHEERMVASLSQLMPGQPVLPEAQYVTWVESNVRLDLDLVRMGMSLWGSVGERGQAMLQALGRVTCPTLVMQSGMWPTGAPVTVKEAPSDRPNVRVVRFENAGHTIDREHFEPFIEWVKAFLKA